MVRAFPFLITLLVMGLFTLPAFAAEEKLPVPRFVSLKWNEVNLRVGPNVTYPIKWVYKRRHMPVEIIEEYEHWRKIRDMDGETGWLHKGQLSGTRTALVTGKANAEFRRFPETTAPIAFHAEPGVIARIERCNADWCYLVITGHKGWLEKSVLFGVYADEKFDE